MDCNRDVVTAGGVGGCRIIPPMVTGLPSGNPTELAKIVDGEGDWMFYGHANPLFLAPSVVGFLAKGGAEALTGRQINALSGIIRNGGPLPGNALAGLDNATLALLAAQSASSAGRSSTKE